MTGSWKTPTCSFKPEQWISPDEVKGNKAWTYLWNHVAGYSHMAHVKHYLAATRKDFPNKMSIQFMNRVTRAVLLARLKGEI